MKKLFLIPILILINQLVFSQDTVTIRSPAPVLMPGMTGPLTANQEPLKLQAGRLGNIYVSGVVSGLLQAQSSVFTGDKEFQSDVSNAQVFVHKTDGLLQFFLHFGGYSIPAIGVPYFRSIKAMDAYYGILPQGYLKIAFSKNFLFWRVSFQHLLGQNTLFLLRI